MENVSQETSSCLVGKLQSSYLNVDRFEYS